MLVREVMSQPPVTVNDTATIKTAIGMFERHDVSAMPVIDHAGHLIGVVSEADVIREMVVPDQRVHEIPVHVSSDEMRSSVADVMTTHPITVSATTELAVAAELMTSTAVKSLPVMDGSRLVGVISRRDIIGVLARTDQRLEADIDELFRQAGHDWLVDVTEGVAVIEGPVVESEQGLAQALANTVPGIVGIRFASSRT